MFDIQSSIFGGETITFNRFEFGLLMSAWGDQSKHSSKAVRLLGERLSKHWNSAYPQNYENPNRKAV